MLTGMLSETDIYLVNAIQKGDYQAFKMLFDSYYTGLCRFARGYVGSVETAEDLVSDLFVKIWEQPQIMAATISLKGYLYRSVYNSCINYLTRTRRRFENLDTETMNNLNALMPQSFDDVPSMVLQLAELDDEIEKAIGQLPAECGKIFIMSRKEELSHREIAQKLNISENTVKVQIYRALSKLREALKEYL
jgi:RNA polymerase sigma-70 factor, ECF subfamily